MHSSRMRTSRLLTVSQYALCRRGVYPSLHWAVGVCLTMRGVWLRVSAQGGVCPCGVCQGGVGPEGGAVWPGGCLPSGVSVQGECGRHPPVNGMTDRQV